MMPFVCCVGEAFSDETAHTHMAVHFEIRLTLYHRLLSCSRITLRILRLSRRVVRAFVFSFYRLFFQRIFLLFLIRRLIANFIFLEF